MNELTNYAGYLDQPTQGEIKKLQDDIDQNKSYVDSLAITAGLSKVVEELGFPLYNYYYGKNLLGTEVKASLVTYATRVSSYDESGKVIEHYPHRSDQGDIYSSEKFIKFKSENDDVRAEPALLLYLNDHDKFVEMHCNKTKSQAGLAALSLFSKGNQVLFKVEKKENKKGRWGIPEPYATDEHGAYPKDKAIIALKKFLKLNLSGGKADASKKRIR